MAIFTAIAAGFAAAGTWFAGLSLVGQFAVKLGASLVLNALSSAFSGKQKPPRQGISGEISQGADVPRSFILGLFATRGSLAYHNSWGKAGDVPNAYYTRVTALSDLPLRGLREVWIDGQRCVLDLANPDPGGKGFPVLQFSGTRQVDSVQRVGGALFAAVEDEFYNRAWVKFHDGTQAGADQFVIDNVATAERPWTGNEIGTGVAYAVVTFQFDRELFKGLPDVLFVLDGVEIADPRTGAQGGADETPAAQAFAILNGFDFGGEWLWGPQGTGAGRVRASEWSAPTAACLAPVPGSETMSDGEKVAAFGSTTVPARYRSGYEVRVDQQPADVLGDILAACAGRLAETGTRYQMQVGDPGAAVLTITDADIISTEGQEFVPFLGLADSVNGVSATYFEPDEGWAIQNAPPLYVAAYEAEDGGRRLLTDVELVAVPYREQVQRLLEAALDEARRARRHSLTLPPEYMRLLPLDYIAWTSDRNGYAAKLMRVDGVVPLPNGDAAVDLTEVDPASYDWSARDQFVPVVSGSILPQPIAGTPVTGIAVFPLSLTDGGGIARRPAIELRWTGRRVENCRGIEWQVRLVASGALVNEGAKADPRAGSAIIDSGIVGNELYEVRAAFIMTDRSPTTWSPWFPVSTDDTRFSYADMADAIRNVLDNAFTEALTIADFATSIRPVELFDTGLPTSGNVEGRQGHFDGRLHLFTGGAWVDMMSASRLQGQLTSAQIAGLAAAKLTGTITETQIADDAISTPKLAAGAVVTESLAAGAVATEKLAVGSGLNWLHNPRFFAGLSGWVMDATDPEWELSIRQNTSYTKTGNPVLQVRQFASTAADVNVRQVRVEADAGLPLKQRFGWPVTEGQMIEASGYISAHRCNVELRIEFRDAAGDVVGFSQVATTTGASSAIDPDLWPRLVVRWPAPAGAATATPLYRKKPTDSGTDSYLMLHKPQLSDVPVNATEAQPWADSGITMVDGDSILTGAVFARHMTADSVTAGAIAAAAINTRELAAEAITVDKMAANSITTYALAAGAVTAAEINVTDLSAISANLGTIQVGSANIENAAVGTLQIGGNAVTVPARAYAAGSVTATTSASWVDVVSVFLERDGFATDLQFSLTASAGDDALVQVGLFRDTFLLQTFTDTIGRTGRQIQMAGALIDTAVGTADIFFHLKIKKVDAAQTGGWNANPTVAGAYISATQFKR